MATLTTQRITRVGLPITYAAAAAGGDKFVPGDKVFLHVKNGGASSVNVTVATTGKVRGDLALANVVVAIPAAGENVVGPFGRGEFQNAVGLVDVTYSAVTSVSVAVLELED